jgi:hypothetical protein
METPSVPMPTSVREKEILQQLTIIRDQLLLLKLDRTNYIRSQDVLGFYDQTVELVRQLNEVRKTTDKSENRRE